MKKSIYDLDRGKERVEAPANEDLARRLDHLYEIFKSVDENKKELVSAMIKNCAYLEAKIETVKETMDREGVVEITGHGTKKSAAVDSYTALHKEYISAMRLLIPLCPIKPGKSQLEKFYAAPKG